jgi:hypothetical protein
MRTSFRWLCQIALAGTFGTLGYVAPSVADPPDEPVASRTDPLQGAVEFHVTKTGTGLGTVSGVPAGIACGRDCSTTLDVGVLQTLVAEPAYGSRFVEWRGAPCGTGRICTLKVGQPVSEVTAVFAIKRILFLPRPQAGKAPNAKLQDSKPEDAKPPDSKPQAPKDSQPPNPKPPAPPAERSPGVSASARPFVAHVGRRIVVHGVRPRHVTVTVRVNARASIRLVLENARGRRVTSRTWHIGRGRRVLQLDVPARVRRATYGLKVTARDRYGQEERFKRHIRVR